jgi:processed acidic surface protein
MKKLLVLLMAVLLVVSALPASTFAIAKDDPEFEKFLEEINWSKKSYINYLMEKNWSLDDFGDVSELGTPLSEEGVQTVMEDFELTREELNELLVEFGDIEEGEDVQHSLHTNHRIPAASADEEAANEDNSNYPDHHFIGRGDLLVMDRQRAVPSICDAGGIGFSVLDHMGRR